MKILFLAHRTPYPPNKGDKIRSYHVLSCLAKKHILSVAYWLDDAKDAAYTPFLKRICQGHVVPVILYPLPARLRGLASLCSGRSFSEGYFYSRVFQVEIDRLLGQERFDLVYIFSSPMAQYVRTYSRVPTLVDFVDVDSDKWGQFARFRSFPLSWFFLAEKERLARYEIAVSRWARWSLFVSQAEAALFKTIGGGGSIVALPNGVDFDLLERQPVEKYPAREKARPAKLVFTGTLNYFPNYDAVLYFVHQIYPLIRRIYPKVTFDIVGRFPPRVVRKLNGKDGIRILGEVADIRPFLIQADVSVAPLRIARGIQNKILEAMAMGVPVVATPQAVEGIEAEDGEEILVASSPEAFAQNVVRLLSDTKLHSRISKRARNMVSRSYNWKTVVDQLENLVAEPTAIHEIS